MVTTLSQPYCWAGLMRELVVESAKALILLKFIKAQHFRHYDNCLYKD